MADTPPLPAYRFWKWFIVPLRRGWSGPLGLLTILLPLILAVIHGVLFVLFAIESAPVAIVDRLFDPGFEPYAQIQPWETEPSGANRTGLYSGLTEVRRVHLDTDFYRFDFMQRHPANDANARAELIEESIVWQRRDGHIALVIAAQLGVFAVLCILWAWIVGLIAGMIGRTQAVSAPPGGGG